MQPNVSLPPAGDLETADDLLRAVGEFRRYSRRPVGRPWPVSQLTAAQLELLRAVRREPDISVAGAAAELGVAANTVSTLVGQLTTMGLLRRQRDPADRRIARLHLESEADAQVTAWRARRVGLIADTFGRLPDQDRASIERAIPALRRLAGLLSEIGSVEFATEPQSGSDAGIRTLP